MTTMRFGKFVGEEVEDLPCWYLKWLDENLDEAVNASLLEAARTEMKFRKREGLTVNHINNGYENVRRRGG